MSELQPLQPSAATLFLTDEDVESLADWHSAVKALREAYGFSLANDMVPPRSRARGNGIWLRSLTAISPAGGHMGVLVSSKWLVRRRSITT